jgi:hypothetical protein
MMQGMMFLPDGRMLIMDKEQYKKIIEQSIVLDLVDNENEQTAQAESNESAINETDRFEEEKVGLRQSKDRKQSQASQKRKVPDEFSHADV